MEKTISSLVIGDLAFVFDERALTITPVEITEVIRSNINGLAHIFTAKSIDNDDVFSFTSGYDHSMVIGREEMYVFPTFRSATTWAEERADYLCDEMERKYRELEDRYERMHDWSIDNQNIEAQHLLDKAGVTYGDVETHDNGRFAFNWTGTDDKEINNLRGFGCDVQRDEYDSDGVWYNVKV